MKIPRAYYIKEKAEVICFLDEHGNKCNIDDATIMMVSTHRDNEANISMPMSIKVAKELHLEEGDEFNYAERYSTFKQRPKSNIPEEILNQVHEERLEFENFCKKNFEFFDTDFKITSSCHIKEDGEIERYYTYNSIYVQMAYETWKVFNASN